MIHVVVVKCLIGLPLLMHIELLRRSRSRSFKNRGVGVRAFEYRLHSPGHDTFSTTFSATFSSRKTYESFHIRQRQVTSDSVVR
jgi:hypothetical protein